MTLGINELMTLIIMDSQYNNTQNNDLSTMTLAITTICLVSRFIYCYVRCDNAECGYAECPNAATAASKTTKIIFKNARWNRTLKTHV
jgi:hypothetical protein